MSTYYSCRNCDNSKEGDRIFQCEECGKIFCEGCCSEDWSGPCVVYRCPKPRCEGRGSRIGWIESKSSDDDDEYYSSYDIEQGIRSYLPQIREYLEKPKEKQSEEILNIFAEALFKLSWLKYPEAESLYYKIRPRSSSYSSSLSGGNIITSSPSNSSSSNSGSSINNSVAKQDDQGASFFLFIVISIIGLIAYNIPTSKESSQSINRISEQRPANLGSDVSLGMIDKPVDHEKLASDTETTTTRNDEAATNIEEGATIDNPTVETPSLLSVSAQNSFDGKVEYVETGNLYIRSTGEEMPGRRIFVRLKNGHKADVFLGYNYNENFNPEERVNVISRNNGSNGTVEYARYDYLESVGERIIDSEIAIRLDSGGIVVVIFPSQEVIFNKGERVRTISYYY